MIFHSKERTKTIAGDKKSSAPKPGRRNKLLCMKFPLKSPGSVVLISTRLLGWWPGVEKLVKVSRENLYTEVLDMPPRPPAIGRKSPLRRCRAAFARVFKSRRQRRGLTV